MPIKFTKNGVDSSFSGSEKFFLKRMKKNPTRYKRAFFLTIFTKKKKLKFWDTIFLIVFERCSKSKKNKLFMIYIGYWLVNFLDHTNIPNFH